MLGLVFMRFIAPVGEVVVQKTPKVKSCYGSIGTSISHAGGENNVRDLRHARILFLRQPKTGSITSSQIYY